MSRRSIKRALLALSSATSLIAGANASRAAGLVTEHRLPAGLANAAVGAAVSECAQKGFGVTASVVDSNNVLQAFLKGDHAPAHATQVSMDKAYTALDFGDTGVLAERLRTAPAPNAVLTKEPHLLAQQGGLAIRVDGERLGGIGVSGGPTAAQDEACAKAGLDVILAGLK
jgi:uncharacterized protein GlcG (DUF336 family)